MLEDPAISSQHEKLGGRTGQWGNTSEHAGPHLASGGAFWGQVLEEAAQQSSAREWKAFPKLRGLGLHPLPSEGASRCTGGTESDGVSLWDGRTTWGR